MSTLHCTTELDWRKATASANGNCVEVAALPEGGVAVRDSKDRSGPVLSFTRPEWVAFLDGMGNGEFDHLV
jgi:predicted secreted Zn-dependent protease